MDREECLKHLAQRHKNANLSKTDLEARVSQAEEKVPVTTFESQPCPLCLKAGWQTTKAYTTHLGQHLEEISLTCLSLVRDHDSCSEADSPTYMEEHAVSPSPPRPAEAQEENVPLSIERAPSSDSPLRQKFPRLSRALGSRLLGKLSGLAKYPPSPRIRSTKESKPTNVQETLLASAIQGVDIIDPSLDNLTGAFDIILRAPSVQRLHACLGTAHFDTQLLRGNLMSDRVWERLNAHGECTLEPPDIAYIQALNSERIHVQGVVRAVLWSFSHGPRTYLSDFYIVDMSGCDILFGTDTIRRYGLIVRRDSDIYKGLHQA